MGIGDDPYRRLSIISSAYKTLQSTLEEVLEIYYGSTATRAQTISGLAAPWILRDGDQLFVEVDGIQLVPITFRAQDFSQIGQASALEVAMAVTRGFAASNNRAYALPVLNPVTGGTYVQIFSPSLGLNGSLGIHGGRAQNIFQFPTTLSTTQAPGTQWTVTTPTATNGLQPGTARFTWSAGTDPTLALVQDGDYANVFGPGFSAANTGALQILDVTTTYFDCVSQFAVAEVVTTTLATDLMFYRPDAQTINSTQRPAFAVTTDILDIVLPTTTEAVVRGVNEAAYLHGNPEFDVVDGGREANGTLTVFTANPHGFHVDDWVQLQGLGVDATTAVAPHWTTDAEPTSVSNPAVCELADGRVLVAGGDTGGSGITNAYVFDPGANTWTSVGPMNVARTSANAILLPSGKVLVAGGSASVVTELFDPASATWTTTGSMTVARTAASGVYVPLTNNVLLMGGASLNSSVESYDVISGAWTNRATVLSNARSNGNAVTLKDGRVLSFGGDGLGKIDMYTPANDVWTKEVGDLTHPRSNARALVTSQGTSGNVYVIGGTVSGTASVSVEILNPATMSTTFGANIPHAAYSMGAGILLDGRIIISGGFNVSNTTQKFTQILDVVNNKWTTGPDTAVAHARGAGVTLDDGRFLVSGPFGNSAEVFTPYLEVSASGGLDGLFKILTTPGGSSFTVQQPLHAETTLLSQGTASSAEPQDKGILGPFIYNNQDGVAITGTMTTTTVEISGGQSYRVLDVASTTDFPASGFLCFDFGYAHQLSPVKYLEILSGTQILLDPTFVFPQDIDPGTTVNYVTQNHPFEPEHPEDFGALYVTTTAAGREAAEAQVKALVAGGIDYKITIEFPGDRGLGNEGSPDSGAAKLSDIVRVYGSDDLDQELADLEKS